MSSARTPLPTLNERDTEQVRSPQGSPNSVTGPLHLTEAPSLSSPRAPAFFYKPRLSSGPGFQPFTSLFRILTWDPRRPD